MKKILSTTAIGSIVAASFMASIIYVPQLLLLIGFLFLSYMIGCLIVEIVGFKK